MENATERIEVKRTIAVILEAGDLSHLITFEIQTNFFMTKQGLTIDGDIKETIYQMREF